MSQYNQKVLDELNSSSSPNQYIDAFLKRAWITGDGDTADQMLANAAQLSQAETMYQRSLPEEQIKRLMSAGLSRTAAIQALQASEYPVASGLGAGMETQNALQAANLGAKAFELTGQLIMNGFNIAQSIPVIRMNNTLAREYPNLVAAQLAGYNAEVRVKQGVANLTDMDIYAKQQYGLFETILEEFEHEHPDFMRPDNWHDMVKFMQGLQYDADKEPMAGALHDWFYDFQHAPSRVSALSNAFMRKSYNEDFVSTWQNSLEYRQAKARAALADLDIEYTSQLINESVARMIEDYQNAKYTDAQIELASAQFVETLARAYNLDVNTKKQLQETKTEFFETILKGYDADVAEYTSQQRIFEALSSCITFANTPIEVWKNKGQQMLYDSRAGVTLAFINAASAIDSKNFMGDNSRLRAAVALENLGVGQYYHDNVGIFGMKLNALQLGDNQGDILFGGDKNSFKSQDDLWNQFKSGW